MIPDLIGREPVRAFPIDQALRREALEKRRVENPVERLDRLRRHEHADVIRRAVDQVGTLSGDGRDDVKIAQLLVLLVERLDHAVGMRGVVLPDELLERDRAPRRSFGARCERACGCPERADTRPPASRRRRRPPERSASFEG